jgi:hypothetical protein
VEVTARRDGGIEVYDISNNQIAAAFFVGNVAADQMGLRHHLKTAKALSLEIPDRLLAPLSPIPT